MDSGGLKGENDETEFAHTFFIRGQEHLLDQIKRKVATKGGPTAQFVPSIRTDRVGCLTRPCVLEARDTLSPK